MLFNSLHFLVFFPVTVFACFALPRKFRLAWLLAASYVFYMSWNPKCAVFLVFATLATYLSGLGMGHVRRVVPPDRKKRGILLKLCVAGGIVPPLGVLFFFKYFNFAAASLDRLLGALHLDVSVPRHGFLLPVGLSFFTFQAISYVMDVYREEVPVGKNLLRHALFVSLFTNIAAGPIERAKRLLPKLAHPPSFDFERMRSGLLLMLWGYFLKIVLADRIAVFVDTVYGDPARYGGAYLIAATVLFAVQIYCDFAGYSTIATGAAEVLGFDIMRNFDAPYLSRSCAAFWRRWHVSLTTWFRDYLYIPLGGNRKGTVRKYLNVMAVFLASGLWHGADWSFVAWGGLNGFYLVAGSILKPVRRKLDAWLGLAPGSSGHRVLQALATFCLVDFAWVFFRADGFRQALRIAKSMLGARNFWIFFDDSLFACGLDRKNFHVMLFSIGILAVADLLARRGVRVRKALLEQDWLCFGAATIVSVLFVLVFGVWGAGYDAAGFIYFQF
jgi:D-alanyl-lipoteichoic acid acyltransferase DltB (MBOAT superfamily)